MKIVALHTDFRIYWPARLRKLNAVLNRQGDSLEVIEIAGLGSPYAFAAKREENDLHWHILFPDKKPEELDGEIIKSCLFKVLAKINPDVIIAGAIAFPSGALAVRWGQKTGIKVIIFDDAKKEAVQRSSWVDWIKCRIYDGVDAMFYPSPDWDSTGRSWGFNPEEIFYGVDVVDNDFWAQPAELNQSWGNYFVSVGRQIPIKNYYSIAQAYVSYHARKGTDTFNWVLIGDGPDHQKIVEFIRENHCSNKVFFLPFQSQKELPAVYQHAQALICNSKSETWGLVINEAMAGGCPVFASIQCGATNTLVHDGLNGYTFSCDDIERLAECMVSYHNLSEEKKVAMRESSKRIIADWGLDRFAQGACAAIDYVASHKKRKTSLIAKLIICFWKGRYRPI